MINIRDEWNSFEGGWGGKQQYDSFIGAFPQDNLNDMTLEQYTALTERDQGGRYFTYWLERGTDSCGKFRTGSSYAYGVYKVNSANKPNGVDNEKWENAKEGYRTAENRNNPKDEFSSQDDAERFFKENVRPKLIKLANFNGITDLKPLEINYCRKIAYLYNPGKLIPIYKGNVIQVIADYFKVDISDAKNTYKVTEEILVKIDKDFGLSLKSKTSDEYFQITQKLGAFLWQKFGRSVALESKNMILHGAPGTGKTYAIENGIKQRLKLEIGETYGAYYKLVQFHPSFGYEEFIDGIKPDGIDENGQMRFKLVNGTFKKMCIDAAIELKQAKESGQKPKSFYFVADEINRAELSRVFGEVLLCLEEDKRLKYLGDDKWEGTKVETLNSALWKEGDAVIVENGGKYFGVPENLYFIGTMNDIDRSVDSFDMALRRRFLWKHYQCDYSVIADAYFNDNNNVDKYKDVCRDLNNFIVGPAGLDLGESFQLGHSYFLKPKKLNKAQLNEVWINHIKPLLREYLRSTVPLGEIEKNLEKAKNLFQLPV